MGVVHIFGASGSGTSTLGRALGAQYRCPWLDTDDYFWAPTNPPYVTSRPPEARLALLFRDLEGTERAVVSGSLCGWGDALIPRLELAVRLVVPTPIRLERLQWREAARFGPRLAPGGDLYDEHREFMDWAARYDQGEPSMRSRAMHDAWSALLSCPLLVLDGTRAVPGLVEEIAAWLG